MANIGQLMKQAQQMQKRMQDVQAKLEAMTVEGKAGGDMVTVVMTCKGEVKSLKISPSAIDTDDLEMTEDLIVAAMNDARKKANDVTEKEMGAITGGMGLPGGMKLPF